MAINDPRGGGGSDGVGFTPLGKIVSVLLIVGLIGVGVWVLTRSSGTDRTNPGGGDEAGQETTTSGNGGPTDGNARTASVGAADSGPDAGELAPTKFTVPRLDPPAPYRPKDNTIVVELSEYAGYAGLIVANGGLEPNDDSIFTRRHGFRVKLTLSEEDSWGKLNRGEMAASATTADVLAVYGRQFRVVVPAQIGFSRGADGVVVRREIGRVNDLRGRTLAAAQFNESDFFIRYLAQEAGLGINMLADLSARPDPAKINLVYCEDATMAGDLFARELAEGRERLAGCVTWAPTTTEVVEGSGGAAKLLTTNKNLLIIADILIVNEGFAKENPKMVAGLVDGLLEGNRMVRENPAPHLDLLAEAFNTGKDPVKDKDDLWDRESTADELTKVHLSNLPENLAFFSGRIDAAGSFGMIYASATLAYGPSLVRNPPDAERFVDLTHLRALEKSGAFKDQKVAIAPIASPGGTAAVEDNPLLSKDIRFFFEPNSARLDLEQTENFQKLEDIQKLLQVSPGSTILLRGHVDDAEKGNFLRQGGEDFLRTMALKAMQLSKDRAAEVKRVLAERYKVDPARLEVSGRGWDEPVSRKSNENRRVEVQWFLVE